MKMPRASSTPSLGPQPVVRAASATLWQPLGRNWGRINVCFNVFMMLM